ncbi:MAG: DUF1016 N-terminal domain-containing protein [Prevotellaceae bacterium]|jgi:hypothetical protein|nr:DUF1016 N-terminal domain-containing protein [Prevotellaceae bacterium]
MNQMEESNYESQFEEIRSLIEFRRNRAFQAVNNELIISNWEVGRYVSEKLRFAKWGSKIVDMLATFLKQADATLKGYDRRAIYRMVQFYDTYCQPEFVVFLPPQIQMIENKTSEIVVFQTPQFRAENKILAFLSLINWTSHLKILSGCTNVKLTMK